MIFLCKINESFEKIKKSEKDRVKVWKTAWAANQGRFPTLQKCCGQFVPGMYLLLTSLTTIQFIKFDKHLPEATYIPYVFHAKSYFTNNTDYDFTNQLRSGLFMVTNFTDHIFVVRKVTILLSNHQLYYKESTVKYFNHEKYR